HTRFSRDWSSDVCSSDLYFRRGCRPAWRREATRRLATSAPDLRHPGRPMRGAGRDRRRWPRRATRLADVGTGAERTSGWLRRSAPATPVAAARDPLAGTPPTARRVAQRPRRRLHAADGHWWNRSGTRPALRRRGPEPSNAGRFPPRTGLESKATRADDRPAGKPVRPGPPTLPASRR